jgi:hypothetical protein
MSSSSLMGKPDPFYLEILKEGTLVLVPAKPRHE